MAPKKRECHVSRWTKQEVEKFDKALANHVNGFAFCLDRIALKKLSNNNVLDHRKKSFDEEFLEVNSKSNLKDKGNVKDYKKLDTSTTRLCSANKTWKWSCSIKPTTLV